MSQRDITGNVGGIEIAHFATNGGFAAGVASARSESVVGAGEDASFGLGELVFDLPEAALCRMVILCWR